MPNPSLRTRRGIGPQLENCGLPLALCMGNRVLHHLSNSWKWLLEGVNELWRVVGLLTEVVDSRPTQVHCHMHIP